MPQYRVTTTDGRSPIANGNEDTFFIIPVDAGRNEIRVQPVSAIQVGDHVRIPSCMDTAGVIRAVERLGDPPPPDPPPQGPYRTVWEHLLCDD